MPALAAELREYLLHSVARTGGHLSSNLGTVELTIALHYVFDTPEDRIVWDVGHQTYPHKILTGRRERMDSLRQHGGISGSLRSESCFDAFGTAHSSTSISAALGMAMAARQKGEDRHAIAVIGDGAMTAGMAFEALNNAGVPMASCWWCSTTTTCRSARRSARSTAHLAQLMSGRFYRRPEQVGKRCFAHAASARAAPSGEEQATGGGAGDAVREVRLQLHRPDRWP